MTNIVAIKALVHGDMHGCMNPVTCLWPPLSDAETQRFQDHVHAKIVEMAAREDVEAQPRRAARKDD